jgi:hypothetical protein
MSEAAFNPWYTNGWAPKLHVSVSPSLQIKSDTRIQNGQNVHDE